LKIFQGEIQGENYIWHYWVVTVLDWPGNYKCGVHSQSTGPSIKKRRKKKKEFEKVKQGE
jgi:hypothetical protein